MAYEQVIDAAYGIVTNDRVLAATGVVVAVSVATYLVAPGFFVGFIVGVISLLAAQAFCLAYLWSIIKPESKVPHRDKVVVGSLEAGSTTSSFLEASELENAMWLSSRPCLAEESATGHGKLRRNVKDFAPAFRRAHLDGLKLLLSGPQDLHEVISLEGCEVKAYSETEDSKKKWNRKFPVRIRHPTRKLWQQSNQFFVYFPDGWEKEMWVFILRRAIRMGSQGAGRGVDPGWQSQIRQKFAMYRQTVQSMYPELLGVSVTASFEARTEGSELKGPRSSLLFRRRRQKGSLDKSKSDRTERSDDWDAAPGGSFSPALWPLSSSHLDKSTVASPLGSGTEQEFQGLRYKLRNFVATKRSMLQDRPGSRSNSVDTAAEGRNTTAQGPSDSFVDDVRDQVSSLDAPILPVEGEAEEGLETGRKGTTTVESVLEDGNANMLPLSEEQEARAGSESEQHVAPGSGPPARCKSEGLADVEGPGRSASAFSQPDTGGSEAQQGESALESSICALNVLVARLFFDLDYQRTIDEKLKDKLQEKLGLILTPAAIGPLTCTKFKFGSSPPLLKSLRPSTALAGLPDGFHAVDVDLIFQGKASFTIETRLDLKDSPYLGMMGEDEGLGGEANPEDSGAPEGTIPVTSEGAGIQEEREARDATVKGDLPALDHQQLGGPAAEAPERAPSSNSDAPSLGELLSQDDPAAEADVVAGSDSTSAEGKPVESGVPLAKSMSPALKDAKVVFPGGSSSSNSGLGSRKSSRGNRSFFKEILVNVASGLSQVPLSITVNVTSVSGVLRVRVPPPPSDRLWMGFVSNPDLQLSFTACIGEKQLKRLPLATKIIEKLKEVISRTLVLPACTDVPIKFMTADNDDWLPREPRMLPWRPAVIPPPTTKGGPESFPASLSEAAAELASVGVKQAGESEVGWEDQPPAPAQERAARRGISSLLDPGLTRRAPSPSTSGGSQDGLGLISATGWRSGAGAQRTGSPNTRSSLTREPNASGRSLLHAAKTSLQSAAGFVKGQPMTPSMSTPPSPPPPPPPPPGQVQGASDRSLAARHPPSLPPAPPERSMRTEIRIAAGRFLKSRREGQEQPPILLSKSTPAAASPGEALLPEAMSAPAKIEGIPSAGMHAEGEREPSLKLAQEPVVVPLITSPRDGVSKANVDKTQSTEEDQSDLGEPTFSFAPGTSLSRITKASETALDSRRVPRSSSDEQLLHATAMEPQVASWHLTPLAAHMSSIAHEEPMHGSEGGSGRASEWHGTDAVKGVMSTRKEWHGDKEWVGGDDGEKDSERSSAMEPQNHSESHSVQTLPQNELQLVDSREVETPVFPGEGGPQRRNWRREKGLEEDAGAEKQLEGPGAGPGAVSGAGAGMFGMRREVKEQWKSKAKDLVGKLGDKEVHAHARAVVGEKAKETKEKAKKLVSFLKEKHAAYTGRQQDSEDAL